MAYFDQEQDIVEIASDDLVTVTSMNGITEVQFMARRNDTPRIRRLKHDNPDEFRYVVLSTGEVKISDISNSRVNNLNSLRQTFKKLRYLINNNFGLSPWRELWVTLTYSEDINALNSSDSVKRVYLDFKRYMTRMRRYYSDLSRIKYLAVLEPQASGRWHLHVLLDFIDIPFSENSKEWFFVDNDTLMSSFWDQGFTKTQRLKDIDNVGAYLSAYLTNIPFDEISGLDVDQVSSSVISEQVSDRYDPFSSKKEKKFIKGGRLRYYPAGVNLYRKSRDVVFPERRVLRYSEALNEIGDGNEMTMSYNSFIHDSEDDVVNVLRFEQYNNKVKSH